MKLGYLLAVLQLTVTAVVAEANLTFIAEEIAKISPCGLGCLEKTIPAAGCSLTNTTCQCANARLVQTTASCMMANCTLVETLSLNQIQASICERPYESQNKKIRIMTIVCAVITNTAALLRFLSRLFLRQPFGWDDWAVGGAIITDGLFTYFGVQLEKDGFGDHVWTIQLDAIPSLFYRFYLCELLYVLTIGLVKCSIVFFYLRVFPKKSLRIGCWATIGFCLATTIAFTLVTTFQCHPIVYIWRKDFKGKCVNYNSVAWANAGINIFQDIIIILLPMNELRHLNLNSKKKVGMYAMFGVGGFVCVTSMIRLQSLKTFGLTADPTWDNIPTTFWSTLETTTAVFCACMPAVRAGIVKLFPKLFGHSSGHGGSTNQNPRRAGDNGTVPSRIVEVKPQSKSISLMPVSATGPKSPDTFMTQSSLSTITEIKSGLGEKRKYSKDNEPRVIRLTAYSAAPELELNKPLPLTPITPSLISSMTDGDEMADVERPPTANLSSTDTSRLIRKA